MSTHIAIGKSAFSLIAETDHECMCNEPREQCSSARCVNCVVLTSYDSDSDWCPSDEFDGLVPPVELGGVTIKRARSRRRHKEAKRDAKASKGCDDVTDLHAFPGPIE